MNYILDLEFLTNSESAQSNKLTEKNNNEETCTKKSENSQSKLSQISGSTYWKMSPRDILSGNPTRMLENLLTVSGFITKDNSIWSKDYQMGLRKVGKDTSGVLQGKEFEINRNRFIWQSLSKFKVPSRVCDLSASIKSLLGAKDLIELYIDHNNTNIKLNFWCLNPEVAFREVANSSHCILLTSGISVVYKYIYL